MGLRAYVFRRLLLFVPTLIGVTLLIFAVMQLFTPTQRATLYITDVRQIRDIDRIIKRYGLDQPIYVQYFNWISEVLKGNLGWSKTAHMPVAVAIIKKAPATLELVLYSLPPQIALGIYLGVKSAVHKDKLIDHGTRTTAIIGWSLPTFWLGMILIAIFYSQLGWFETGRLSRNLQTFVLSPASGWNSYTGLYTIDGLLNLRPDITLDALRHLVLPVITLTIVQTAVIIRVMRSSMLETLSKGYIIAARAKGLAEKEVINKHARRNAMIPVITLSGIIAGIMLTGLVITETVFRFPGLGRFAVRATIGLDVPAILGFSLFAGTIFVVTNLIVDILYAYVDPRIRLV